MTRRVALILAAASVGALAGCDGVVGARMTFDDTEKNKITAIVLAGGHGDIMVATETGATETKIRRIVQGGTGVDTSYQVAGGVLTLDTDCGRDCGISYEITAPPGVAVRGELTSGDVTLSAVGPVDLQLTSGDVMVERATGPVKLRATSGDVQVIGGTGVDLESRSGNLDVLESTGPVTARLTSGDISLSLIEPSSVTASTTSGEINLMVPPGDYKVSATTGNGEARVEEIKSNPKATNVLDLRTRDGDIAVVAG
ncbi:DUF4097 family beta strand repeat-containing protein [Actinoplanes derwentensis]|uniref:Putative adhesin n=1 Tax=Actinoplanes derwentensis TaxID=113562 RepID=A0A1H2CB01_9ACTN|nr:DUF4097 family beta strand repeat-containing protein [Actinoplanes derwentensis]GID89036.1 hypothetical protein Ade03nite_79600 [Actinoplanes derwentensis]SDT67509.1 Putative adhesin [Actinoplanes derwentensis]